MYTFDQKYKQLRQQLFLSLSALAMVFLIGTGWYWLVEEWSLLDAAYMTMITLSTVGFGEIHPLGEKSRLFTMILIIMGLITIGNLVNLFTEALIQGYFQERLRFQQEQNLISSLTNHYIVCGFGRMGRQIAQEFESEKIPFLVIDSEAEQIEIAKQQGYITILGDATLDESLIKAKIQKAICLVAALSSDAENLYTVLSAKTLNSKIRAIARANTEEAVTKLQRVGADAVVSPYITGAKRLAAAALRPQVMDFVDGILSGSGRSFYLEEILLDPEICPYVGESLRNAQIRAQSGALVLAVRRVDSDLIMGPTGDTLLMAGDVLICMGTAEQLHQLNRLLGPIRSSRFREPKNK